MATSSYLMFINDDRNKFHRRYSELNFLHNVFRIFKLSEVTEWRCFVTYLSNELRSSQYILVVSSCNSLMLITLLVNMKQKLVYLTACSATAFCLETRRCGFSVYLYAEATKRSCCIYCDNPKSVFS